MLAFSMMAAIRHRAKALMGLDCSARHTGHHSGIMYAIHNNAASTSACIVLETVTRLAATLGYRQILVRPDGSGGGGCGLMVARLGDDLDPIAECHTEHEFWQLVVTIKSAPTFLCALDQFEDHCERSFVRQAALRSDRAVTRG
jgi:hypothetical protein